MTTSADSSPRLVAGRYRLGAVLGRGAMGTVWSAHDEVLGRPVAIKEVLLPPGIPDAEADALRERSLREARAIAALSHPNVVTLYDVAREGGAPFVVMELVASRSLADLLREKPLPPQRAAEIGAAVAAALQAAHAAGITHRDVKPGNVLVAHDGRIKLTDFGIARNPADQTMTGTGLMLGSPAYIAPEVASGGKVSAAADLWGLGATLFAAVEGRPPYDSGDPVATVSSVVLDEVPAPSCGGPLAEVIGGLMRKDPAARMPLSRVRMLLGAPPVPQAPPQRRPPPPRSRPAPSPWPGPPPRPNPPPAPAAVPPSTAGQLAVDPGPLPFAPAEPDAPRPGRRRRASRAGRAARAGVWLVAVLLFLLTAAGGFAAARVALGATPLPELGAAAPPRPAESLDQNLITRTVRVSEADGTDPATFTLGVPQDWPEFHEQGVLGSDTGSVVRFPSPDGAELITVERATGFLRSGDLDEYLSRYGRALRKSVPEAVLARREPLPGGMIDATFRTMEGRGPEGELRRTEYLRLVPSGTDLWVVRVTVPTEREATGRNRLFEPVVQRFVPHG